MTQRALLWAIGAGTSLAFHAALLGGLVLSVEPDPVPQQPMPEARLNIEAYEVDRSEARQETASTEEARPETAKGTPMANAAVPLSRAKAVAARTEFAQPTPNSAEAVVETALAGHSAKAKSETVTGKTLTQQRMALVQPDVIAAVGAPVPQVRPPATTGTEARPKTTVLADAPVAGLTRVAQQMVPDAQRATAALAWSGSGNETVDPVSLAAIQAFMQPGDLSQSSSNAGSVRDGIADLLASVPCARLQTVFVPETGTLELRGHLPEDALRLPVLAALQTQIGSAIPVADNLLILPRPQCGALSGIANVGLPQSTEQLTNPRVVGTDAHARAYQYAAGQRLTFELTAPDYDAYVYVDYFDAEGMVLHLQPNEIVPLEASVAKSQLGVGVERPGKPSLNITIAPPFGQEIAVAFASSVPLYDGLRPIEEPAEPYLDFLKTRVEQARNAVPDFKGEWVYFFIATTE